MGGGGGGQACNWCSGAERNWCSGAERNVRSLRRAIGVAERNATSGVS